MYFLLSDILFTQICGIKVTKKIAGYIQVEGKTDV